MTKPSVESLVNLGLTGLEAEIYVYLLQHSPESGYGVAKALRKAAPNVYKAIETLEEKGGLIADRGNTVTLRAVPATEFLSMIERRFRLHHDTAKAHLARIPESAPDTRVYQVESRDLLLEYCRHLLASARMNVLMDAFPVPFGILRDDIAAAAARGVEVRVKIFEPDSIPGVELILESSGELTQLRWPEQWIDCVADGARFVVGLLSPDGEHLLQAVRSESPYLAHLHYARLAAELQLTLLEASIPEASNLDEVKAALKRANGYFALDTPGYKALRYHLDESESALE